MATKDIRFILSFDDKGTATIKRATKTTKKELDKLSGQAKKSGKGFDALGKQVKTTEGGMGKMKKMLSSTWSQMAMGMGVMVGVQGAFRLISRQLSSVVTYGREFERAWANVRTMLDEGVVDQVAMRKELMLLPPALGDATELARGMYQVLSASVEPSKAMEVLAVSAMSAKAGVTEVATSVDAITTVLNAYGMQAEEASRVSDIMFKTVKRGKLTYEGMAGAIGSVVPIASQVGVSFEEIAGAMATLTKQGIDVNTTTVQLRQVLVSVLKPTKEAEVLARRLGIEFNATALRAKGLSGFLADVQDKTKGDAEAMSLLFGNVRALTGVMGLAGKSADVFTKDLFEMRDASGATEEAFLKQMESMDFQIEMFKTQAKKMKQAFYLGFVENFKMTIESIDEYNKKAEVMIIMSELAGDSMGKLGKKALDVAKKFTGPGIIWGIIEKQLKQQAEEIYKARLAFSFLTDTVDKGKDVFKDAEGVLGLVSGKFNEIWGRAKMAGISLEDFNKMLPNIINNLDDVDWATDKFSESLDRLSMETALKVETALQADSEALLYLASTGKFTQKQLETTAKGIADAYTKEGMKAGNAIRAMAGDFTFLAEEVGSLEPVLEGGAGQLIKMTKVGTLIGAVFVPQVYKALEGMKKLYDISKENAVVYEADVSRALNKLVGDYKLLTSETNVFGEITKESQFNMVKQIVKYHKQLSIKVPKYWEDLYKKLKKETERGTKNWLDENAQALETLGTMFQLLGDDVGGTFGNLFSSVGGALEQLGTMIQSGTKDWSKLITALVPAFGEVGGAIGEMIGGLKEGEKSFAKFGSAIGGTIGSLIPGMGILGKAVGSLVGGLIGGLFKKQPEKSEADRLMEELEQSTKDVTNVLKEFGKVSESVAKSIAETAREMDGFLAVSIHFGDVIRDVGVNQDNVNALWNRSTDIVKQFESGLLTSGQATTALDDAFQAMLEGVLRMDEEGSVTMLNFIAHVRRAGLEVESLNEYIDGWLDKGTGALEVMIEGAKDTEEEFERLGRLTITTFTAMLDQGYTLTEALDAMADPINALIEKQKELGITSENEALKQIIKIQDLRQTHGELFNAVDANKTILEALGNTGFLTAEALDDVAKQAQGYYERLTDAGLTSQEAMAIMAPTLQELQKYAENYGYALDPATQALIDQATGMGVLKEGGLDMATVLEQGFSDIIDKFDELIFKFSDMVDEMAKVGDPFGNANRGADYLMDTMRDLTRHGWDIDVNYNESSPSGPSTGAQHGFHDTVTGPRNFHIEAGRTEKVDIEPVSSKRAGGGGTTIIERPAVFKPVIIPLEGKEGWVLDIVKEATDDERLDVNVGALRR